MSVVTPAASRLLCRSLAANSAKTSSRALASSRATASSCQQQQQQRHQFHSSTALEGRRKRSPFRNVKAEKMGLLDPERPEVMEKFKHTISPNYDDADLEKLQKKYTPEQLEALQLGERAVSTEDLVMQGRLRNDPYRMRYTEDFATVRPHLDKRERIGQAVDSSARFMTPDEFADDFVDFLHELEQKQGTSKDLVDMEQALAMYEEMRSKMLSKENGEPLTKRELVEALDRVIEEAETPKEVLPKVPKNEEDEEVAEDGVGTIVPEDKEYKTLAEADAAQTITDLHAYKYLMERNSMTGFDGGINDTAVAPSLPKEIPGVAGLYKKNMNEEDAALDPEGAYQEIRRQTGMTTREILGAFNRDTKIIVTRYVSNQTRLGKIRSASVLAIAGNKDGRLGIGEAKSVAPETASRKAKLLAIKNMQPVRRYENRTIYGNVQGKVGATIVNLYARPPGKFLSNMAIPPDLS